MDTLSSLTTAPAEALLSGRAGCAIIRSGDAFYHISVDEPHPTPCDATYWSHLRALHPEGEVMEVGEHPFREAERALRASWQRDRALRLTLIALDAEHATDLRLRACSAAEPLLAEAVIHAFLRSRLLSRAPPPDADFEGARAIAEQAGVRTMAQILAEVIASKEALTSVLGSWDRIVRELPMPADRAEATRDVERAGVIARFVVAVRQGMTHDERSELTSWLVTSVAPTLRIPQPLVLLNRWLNDIVPKNVRRYPDARPAAEVWAVREGNAEQERYSRSQDRGPQPRGHEAKQRVDAQKSAIVLALMQGRSNLVERYVRELLDDQERNGGNAFAAKSLCALAREAERLGENAWVDRWLVEAVTRAPQDEVAWVQLSAFRSRHGRSKELLAFCEQMLRRVRPSAHVLCTKAEVLRALGRPLEALDAYDEAIARFPEDVVARTGRAEVLKAQGRPGEALAAYDETIARFPEDVVARTGRAEVLKAQGHLSEARAAYEAVLVTHPSDAYARTGLALILMAQGQLARAEEYLQAEFTPGTLAAWFRLHIRGLLALRQNDLDRAQQIFTEGRRDCPFASLHARFQGGLALVLMRANHPERAVAELSRSEPAVEELQQVSRALILAHALAANGDLSGATGHLARPSEVRLPVVVRLRETLAWRFGIERDRADDAQALEERIFEDELQLLAS